MGGSGRGVEQGVGGAVCRRRAPLSRGAAASMPPLCRLSTSSPLHRPLSPVAVAPDGDGPCQARKLHGDRQASGGRGLGDVMLRDYFVFVTHCLLFCARPAFSCVRFLIVFLRVLFWYFFGCMALFSNLVKW